MDLRNTVLAPFFTCAFLVAQAAVLFPSSAMSLPSYAEHKFSGSLTRSMAAIGDLNGDGVTELALHEYYEEAVEIYSGIDRSHIITLNGTSSEQNYGWDVSELDDVNNDGTPDFLVVIKRQWTSCSQVQPTPAADYQGAVRVVSGEDFSSLYTITGGTNRDYGFDIAVLDDLNNDGIRDFVVGAPTNLRTNNDPCGNAYGTIFLYSGANGSLIRSHTDAFGFGDYVANVGDVDNDGTEDYAAGTQRTGTHFTHVYSGDDGTLIGAISGFGGPITGIGDVNGDGKADFVIGDALVDSGSTVEVGSVKVFSGATLTALNTINGTAQNERLGYSVSALGDLNGDGKSDFLALAAGATSTTNGYARIYSGANANVLAEYFKGGHPGDFSNGQIQGLGLVDNDSVPDFFAGDQIGKGYLMLSNTPYGGKCSYRRIASGVVVCM